MNKKLIAGALVLAGVGTLAYFLFFHKKDKKFQPKLKRGPIKIGTMDKKAGSSPVLTQSSPFGTYNTQFGVPDRSNANYQNQSMKPTIGVSTPGMVPQIGVSSPSMVPQIGVSTPSYVPQIGVSTGSMPPMFSITTP